MKTTKAKYLGSCPVCERDQRTRDGAMVHHGYRRPGDGRDHGDCYGVGYPAYELSPKGCEDWKASMEKSLANLEEALAAIPGRTHWSYTRKHLLTGEWITTDYAIGVTDTYTWDRAVESETRNLERQAEGCRSEINRMARRIAAWSAKELRAA